LLVSSTLTPATLAISFSFGRGAGPLEGAAEALLLAAVAVMFEVLGLDVAGPGEASVVADGGSEGAAVAIGDCTCVGLRGSLLHATTSTAPATAINALPRRGPLTNATIRL